MKSIGFIVFALILFFPLAGFKDPAKGKKNFKGYEKKANGSYLKLIQKGTGTTTGDSGSVIFMKLRFLTDNDTTLLDINKTAQQASYPLQLEKPKFKGDFLDLFGTLHSGDSACFFVSLDSLHKYYPQDFIFDSLHKDMKYLGFAVRVDSIYNWLQVREYGNRLHAEQQKQKQIDGMMQLLQSSAMSRVPALVKQDSALFASYISYTKVGTPDASGSYYIEKVAGTGASVAYGKRITLRYSGTFLDGTIFDSNDIVSGQRPLVVDFNPNSFIPGFASCILKMKAGGKARFVLPSSAAYQDGLTRIFDVQIISVE